MSDSADDHLPPHEDEEVAARLLLPLRDFWKAAGRGWQRVDMEEPRDDVDWWMAGDPPQVMLGLARGDSTVFVARPEGRWRDRLTYAPAQPLTQVLEPHSGLREAIDQASAARRRPFGGAATAAW